MARFPLVARILQRIGSRSLACPGESELAAFADGTLPAEARVRVEKHMLRCADCLDAASQLVKWRRDNPALAVPPALLVRVRALQSSPRPRWMAPAAAAVGAAALLVAIVLMVRPTAAPPNSHATIHPLSAPLTARNDLPPATIQAGPTGVSPRQHDLVRRAPSPIGLVLLTPTNGSKQTGAIAVKWRPVEHALAYDVRILSAEGDVVYEASTEADHFTVPADVRLTDGRYFVVVHAVLPAGVQVESSAVAFTFKSGS
jgi:hypothetical protein